MATIDGVEIDVKKFWEDGFLTIRRLFPPEYFHELREKVCQSLKRRESTNSPATDCLGDPLLARFVYDPRLLAIARTLLGSHDIAYFGDSNYAVVGHGYEKGVHVGGWHRDNTDRSNLDAPDWKSRYSLIRFGLYLQNHGNKSGGLIVRRTSHNQILRGLKAHLYDRYLNTNVGDVGVWSMRIQHAGLGRCVRGMPWIGLGPYWQRTLPEFMQAPFGSEERAGFWISYALDDAHLQRHCEYLLGRTERLSMWRDSYYSDETLEACAAAGLKVVNMPERMRALLASGNAPQMHDSHYQLAH